MKRIAGSILLLMTIGLTTSMANDNPFISEKLKSSLKKEFAAAAFVKWSNLGEYHMASFLLDGYNIHAYFNADCELEGTARYILVDQLPRIVMKTFNKRYSGADFSDILEVNNTEGTFYWVTVTTKTKIYRVKASHSGNILAVNRKKQNSR